MSPELVSLIACAEYAVTALTFDVGDKTRQVVANNLRAAIDTFNKAWEKALEADDPGSYLDDEPSGGPP